MREAASEPMKIAGFALVPCLLLLLSSGLSSCTSGTAEAEDRLKVPFEASSITTSRPPLFFTCPALPLQPVRDLHFESIYDQSDPSRSRVDPESERTYRKAISPLQDFETELVSMANNYLRYASSRPAYAECVLEWLHPWAKEEALLGDSNILGGIVRHWTLASLSSAYAQIKDEPSLDSKKKESVEDWLHRVADRIVNDYPVNSDLSRKKNNHLYWAAWSVTLTGTAINDRRLYDWGISKVKYVLVNQIHGDGTLPLELARGSKAFHYHVFAAAPLVMIAEAGLRNGDDLYQVRDGILHRLVIRILNEMEDPGYFSRKTSITQTGIRDISPSHFAWLEAYLNRFPEQDRASDWLHRNRPLFQRRTGGDMSFLFYQPSD